MFSEVVSSRTEDVVVSVQTAYLPAQSNPSTEHYMFIYRVRITNESDINIQLVSRQWFITDAYGRKRKVEGEGVVGEQPVLAPGESHTYVSGCDFKTPIGQMKGFFNMMRCGQGPNPYFNVRIPTFSMCLPSILN